MELLRGRVALVCGATGLVGSAIARAYAAQRAVVVAQYHESRLRAFALAEELGLDSDSQVMQANLVDLKSTLELVDRTRRQLGRISIVVNCVHGRVNPIRAADLDWDDWAVHLDALRAHVNLCRASLPQLREGGGSIIFISGALAVRFYPGCAAYSAVKAGLEAYCRTLALEEGKNGITVNVISPGLIRVPGMASPPVVPGFEEIDRLSRARMALKEEPTSDDVAAAAVFLASGLASQVTGQTVFLTGGEVMCP